MPSLAGALLKTIARRILHLTLLQYVDDYYGPAHMDCVQHCMEVFARLAACWWLGPAPTATRNAAGGLLTPVFSLLCKVLGFTGRC